MAENPSANAGDTETWVPSLGQKEPLEKEKATLCSILASETPRQGSLADYTVHGAAKVRHDSATEHAHVHAHTGVKAESTPCSDKCLLNAHSVSCGILPQLLI